MTLSTGKQEWRRALLAARRVRSAAARGQAREAIAAHLREALDAAHFAGTALQPAGRPAICAYLPLESEPLPPQLPDLLAGRGWRVLLPVSTPGAPLDWAECQPGDTSRMTRSPIGVMEPTGPRLGPQAVTEAAVILVPALAVDAAGYRLGRGGGFYDRTLALVAKGTAQIAVIYDDELVDALPHESHDIRVTHVLTPSRGLARVGAER